MVIGPNEVLISTSKHLRFWVIDEKDGEVNDDGFIIGVKVEKSVKIYKTRSKLLEKGNQLLLIYAFILLIINRFKKVS